MCQVRHCRAGAEHVLGSRGDAPALSVAVAKVEKIWSQKVARDGRVLHLVRRAREEEKEEKKEEEKEKKEEEENEKEEEEEEEEDEEDEEEEEEDDNEEEEE